MNKENAQTKLRGNDQNRKKNEYTAYQPSVKSPLLEGARVARKPVNVFGDKFLLVLCNINILVAELSKTRLS